MDKNTFCVVVPALNEEEVIGASLQAMKKILSSKDIFVVSDGSTDKTALIAKKANVNVMNLRNNCGKATALKKLIKSRNLTKRYSYVLFSDADSRLSENFMSEIKKYKKQKPALIVGTVNSDRKGLISAFRTYEYCVSHKIYKSAQNFMSAITVAPGCASLYRSDVLEKLDLQSSTLTEDFDLTIQIHKKKLGQIIYAPLAVVTTQDPMTFKDYWKQVLRWNTGTWQNIFLHKLYKPNSKLNLELYFLLFDNMLWIIIFALAIMRTFIFVHLFLGTFITISALALLVSFIEKKYWIIPFIPFFSIFYCINIFCFYYSIFRVLFGAKKNLLWNKVNRYSVAPSAS